MAGWLCTVRRHQKSWNGAQAALVHGLLQPFKMRKQKAKHSFPQVFQQLLITVRSPPPSSKQSGL